MQIRRLPIYVFLLLYGCAGNPSIRGAETVSIKIYDDLDFVFDSRRMIDPFPSAGTLAADMAGQGLRDCSDPSSGLSIFVAPFCALLGAAIGAGVGLAGRTATDAINAPSRTQPEDTAGALGVEKPEEFATAYWRNEFQDSLERQGRERGRQVVSYPNGTVLNVVIEDLRWSIDARSRASIEARFMVAVGSGDRYRQRAIAQASPALDLEDWLADSGARIELELTAFFDEAGRKIWEAVDGRGARR